MQKKQFVSTKIVNFSTLYTFILLLSLNRINACQQKCTTLKFKKCTVCYQQCNGKDSFHMNSCKYQYCTVFNSKNNQKCQKYEYQQISEQNCTSTCCGSPEYQKFSSEKLINCYAQNQDSYTQEEVIKAITFGSVFGIFGLCVLSGVLYKVYSYFPNLRAILRRCVRRICKKQRQNQDNQDNEDDLNYQNNHKNKKLNKTSLNKILRNTKWIQIQDTQNLSKPTSQQSKQTCAICLQGKPNFETKCLHRFHIKCFLQWIKRKDICPLCVTKNFNPVKLTCQECHHKQLFIPLTYQSDKNLFTQIMCDECQSKANIKVTEMTISNLNALQN